MDSGRYQAQRAVLQAVEGDGDPTTPMGTAKVQERKGAYYHRIPVELVREHEIEAGDEWNSGTIPPLVSYSPN